MKYRIARLDPNSFDIPEMDTEAFIVEMAIHGYEFVKLCTNTRLRPELQGQPMFKGLIGPCYGGEGIVRYEDQATYDSYND